MKKTSLYDVLRAPIISEKATAMSEANKLVFKVAANADKKYIMDAIFAIYNIKPTAVNILNVKGKSKRFKGIRGRRNHVKKAIVTLPENHGIEIVSGA